jgi:hypothetical protein
MGATAGSTDLDRVGTKTRFLLLLFQRRVAITKLSALVGTGLSYRFIVLLSAFWACSAGATDDLRFVPLVQFRLGSVLGSVAGGLGSLSTRFDTQQGIRMRLTNVAAAGADKSQELLTLVDRSDLSLINSVVNDVVKGKRIRMMQRKVGTSILDNKKTDIFEFTELEDGRITTTEPYVEFKVVDFLSVMLVAADAVHRKVAKPIDLSMLRERSVTRVTLRIVGPETVGGRPGTIVRVVPPDNPNGGVEFVICQTNDGSYYPARIRVETGSGLVELEGLPQ